MISVENIGKEYRLGVIGGTTLKEEIQRYGAKLLHKEDPTLKIGESRVNQKGMFMALSDISFTVKKGEALGIIGHNGAGKSTLLKLITRITAPSEGIINLNGRVASMLEVGTGFHPELTGRENIYVNGAILGMTKKEIDRKIEDIIEFSECREFIDTPVKRYSSGMYVKLAFSVAAHLDSEIVIMDEVLAVGDVAFQNKCIQKMKEIAQSGRTVLYVSHNMGTIRALCDRCIVLSKGKLVYDGDVEDAISYYIATNFDFSCFKELDNAKRAYRTTQQAHIISTQVMEKSKCAFYMGEHLKFILTWNSKLKFDHMQLRMVVFSMNGHAVGISYSEEFFGNIGMNRTLVDLDISNILPGKYRLEIIMNEIDSKGVFVKHDIVTEAVMFEVIAVDTKPVYYAYNTSWGYVELGNAVCTCLQ